MKTVSEIVIEVGMNDDPFYYSGRMALETDLSGDMLYNIYQQVKNEVGKKAAENMVILIRKINVLSATNFLNHMYGLEYAKWDYLKAYENGFNFYHHGYRRQDKEVLALIDLQRISTLASYKQDETKNIKNQFFKLLGYTELIA
jgi:hypothetical protein